MFAVIVNTLAIIAGSLIGLCIRRGVPEHLTDALMKSLGLCTIVIGIEGALHETNILIMIVAVSLGVFALCRAGRDAAGPVVRLFGGFFDLVGCCSRPVFQFPFGFSLAFGAFFGFLAQSRHFRSRSLF